MEISRRVFFAAVVLLFAPLLHAEIHFLQRFSWKADDAALEYRIEVQNADTGQTESAVTKENFAEFSLAAGSWRYRVSAYNLLGVLSYTSEWKDFVVRESPLSKDGGGEFTQTLSWKGGSVASWRVELENTESASLGIFETDQNSARLSLGAGKYRYRVFARDALGRLSEPSDWVNFEVFKANAPVIKKIDQKVAASDGGKVALGVDIENITEGSVVELIRETEEGSFAQGGESVKGKAGNETGSADAAYFDKVGSGTWRLRVTNPSGLSAVSEPFEVEGGEKTVAAPEVQESGRKYRSVTIYAGLGLWFSPYDGAFLERNNATYFGTSLVPALSAGVQALPFTAGKSGRDHWGFALAFDGTRLLYRGDAYRQTTMAGLISALAVYHRSLASDRLFVAFKAGAGAGLS